MGSNVTHFGATRPRPAGQRLPWQVASPVNQRVSSGVRPEVNVPGLMGQFYLLEMMQVAQRTALQEKGQGLALRHPVQTWLREQEYDPQMKLSALQGELLQQEVPRIYALLLRRVAGELQYLLDEMWVRPHPRFPTASSREERDWVRSVLRARTRGPRLSASEKILDAASARGLTGKEFGELARELFADELFWPGTKNYGGKPWAQISDALTALDMSQLGVWLDHVFSLQHNNGNVFTHGNLPPERNPLAVVVKCILDYKFEHSNPVDFLALLDRNGVEVPFKLRRMVERGSNIGLWNPGSSNLTERSGRTGDQFFDK